MPSLNGGVGSNDAPEHVAENRARMAAALGVTPDRFITAYQIHSPDVVVADKPWTPSERPRADAIVTRVARLAIGVSTADCGPLLFADGEARRDRRRACRLARRAHRRDRGDARRHGKTRRETCAHRWQRSAPPSASRITRSGRNSSNASWRQTATNARFFAPSERAGHAMFDLTRLHRRSHSPRRHCEFRESRPVHLRRARTLLQLPPYDQAQASRITAAISTPSRSSIDRLPRPNAARLDSGRH